jgi:3-oxoacyl-[acyl-carrier-protein] synthase-3
VYEPEPRVGLRGIAYHFDGIAPIEEIPMLARDPRLVDAFKEGGHVSFAWSQVSLAEQAVISARKTLDAAKLTSTDIDAVIIGTSEMPWFKRIPEMLSTHVLMGLGLRDIPVVGVTLAGCANYASSLRVARNMIMAEGMRNVLVIETNQVRGEMQRPYVSPLSGAAGAIFADGAASFIVTTDEADFALVSMAQIVKPIDKLVAQINDVVANNVTAFRHVTPLALSKAGISLAEVRKIIMSNVNLPMLSGLAATLELPAGSIHMDNVARTGHVWSADNLINLVDYSSSEEVPPGSWMLMLCQAESYYSAIVIRRTHRQLERTANT